MHAWKAAAQSETKRNKSPRVRVYCAGDHARYETGTVVSSDWGERDRFCEGVSGVGGVGVGLNMELRGVMSSPDGILSGGSDRSLVAHGDSIL